MLNTIIQVSMELISTGNTEINCNDRYWLFFMILGVLAWVFLVIRIEQCKKLKKRLEQVRDTKKSILKANWELKQQLKEIKKNGNK